MGILLCVLLKSVSESSVVSDRGFNPHQKNVISSDKVSQENSNLVYSLLKKNTHILVCTVKIVA
jgi:hypothetical protein